MLVRRASFFNQAPKFIRTLPRFVTSFSTLLFDPVLEGAFFGILNLAEPLIDQSRWPEASLPYLSLPFFFFPRSGAGSTYPSHDRRVDSPLLSQDYDFYKTSPY